MRKTKPGKVKWPSLAVKPKTEEIKFDEGESLYSFYIHMKTGELVRHAQKLGPAQISTMSSTKLI
jgi:hypothetical protein